MPAVGWERLLEMDPRDLAAQEFPGFELTTEHDVAVWVLDRGSDDQRWLGSTRGRLWGRRRITVPEHRVWGVALRGPFFGTQIDLAHEEFGALRAAVEELRPTGVSLLPTNSDFNYVTDDDIAVVGRWDGLRALVIPLSVDEALPAGPTTLRPLVALSELVHLELSVAPERQPGLIGELPALRSLVTLRLRINVDASSEALSIDGVLEAVGKLSHLERLTIAGDGLSQNDLRVTPAALDHLARLPRLRRVDLFGVDEPRDVHERLRRALPECKVNVDS